LAALGQFFALDSYPDAAPPTPPWQPIAGLADPDAMARRAEQVAAALAGMTEVASDSIHMRVALSVAHLGLTARLASPLLGLALLQRRLPSVILTDLYWQPDPGGAFPLAVAESALARTSGPDALDDQFARWLRDGPVGALTRSAAGVGAPIQTLWGNVASAIHAAGTVLTRAEPALQDQARAFVSAVLALPPLAGRHTTTVDGRFRRTNCCLIYQVAGDHQAICGDCVLQRV
jgi:hypothetical protein